MKTKLQLAVEWWNNLSDDDKKNLVYNKYCDKYGNMDYKKLNNHLILYIHKAETTDIYESRVDPNHQFSITYKYAEELNILDEWNTWEKLEDILKNSSSIEEVALKHAKEQAEYLNLPENYFFNSFMLGVEYAKSLNKRDKDEYNEAYQLGLNSQHSQIPSLEEMMEFDIWFKTLK